MVAIASAVGLFAAAAVRTGAGPAKEGRLEGSFPLVELRQYTLRDGQRDVLIRLFEHKFIENQEAEGMKVLGTFTDLDRPNRFVWLRGFKDMDSRHAGLTAFYGGPVWKAHRDEANATMIDSDNVLLLRAPAGAGFSPPAARPASGEQVPSGLIVATIYYLKVSPAEALPRFEKQVKPGLEKAGIRPLAWFVRETAPNNFPRLPVREGEHLLVWFARFDSELDHGRHRESLAEAAAILAPSIVGEPEVLRLKPTARSLLR